MSEPMETVGQLQCEVKQAESRYRYAIGIKGEDLPALFPSLFSIVAFNTMDVDAELDAVQSCKMPPEIGAFLASTVRRNLSQSDVPQFVLCYFCGHKTVAPSKGDVIDLLTDHFRVCEQHPLGIEIRELRKAITNLRQALWFYAEAKPVDMIADMGDTATRALAEHPAVRLDKEIVMEGIQPK